MAELKTRLSSLTDEQITQHQAVLNVAHHNLKTIIGSIQMLDNPVYDMLLECLDYSNKELNKLLNIPEEG